MEKCLSLGLLKKVPVINEEYERLTQADRDDPHKLFKAINDPNNAYSFKMKAFFDSKNFNISTLFHQIWVCVIKNIGKDNNTSQKNKIDVAFQARQSVNIEAPFARFPMPNLKTISLNPIVKLKTKES